MINLNLDFGNYDLLLELPVDIPSKNLEEIL
jgi:hypothetical protein